MTRKNKGKHSTKYTLRKYNPQGVLGQHNIIAAGLATALVATAVAGGTSVATSAAAMAEEINNPVTHTAARVNNNTDRNANDFPTPKIPWDKMDFTWDTWSDDATKTITGFSDSGKQKIIDNNGVLVIPEGVEKIENFAFWRNRLTSVEIPKGVKVIGNSAFYENRLTNIVIPEGVENIGDDAFRENQLVSAVISKGVKTIGQNAFSKNRLTSITIPEGVEEIGGWAFVYNDLTSVVISKNVKNIGMLAFMGNYNLTKVKISEGVENIGDEAFESCRLTSVEIPKTVKTIGEHAFSYNKLTEVKISDGVENIGKSAFILNSLTSITIPKSVKNIGDNAFENNNFTNIKISDGVENIGKNAFAGENSLTSVEIPKSVKTISDMAFYGCGLTEVKISEGVENIGDSAFANNRLTSITIPKGVKTIGKSAFIGNRLTSVTIPEGVEKIGKYAFAYNKLSGDVTIPKIENIGEGIFKRNHFINTKIPDFLHNKKVFERQEGVYYPETDEFDFDFVKGINNEGYKSINIDPGLTKKDNGKYAFNDDKDIAEAHAYLVGDDEKIWSADITVYKPYFETVKANNQYIADGNLQFNEKKVISPAVDGKSIRYYKESVASYNIVKEKSITPSKDGVIHVGNKKVETTNKDGKTIVTVTVYDVDKATGDLTNPHVVSTTTTEVKREAVHATTTYLPDDDRLDFGKQNVVVPAVDGEKEVTYTTTESLDEKRGKKDSKVITPAQNGIVHVGNRKVETTTGKNGEKTVTVTTYDVDKTNGNLINPRILSTNTTEVKTEAIPTTTTYVGDSNINFGEKKVITPAKDGSKEAAYTTNETPDERRGNKNSRVVTPAQNGVVHVGNKKVEVTDKDGKKITTVTIYDVDKTNGELTNPRVTVTTVIEVKTEPIPAVMTYEGDGDINFGEKKVVTTAENGEKVITFTTTETPDEKRGNKDVKVTKLVQNGTTKVGNKKVEVTVDKNGNKTTTITTYDVDKHTGELINPKVKIVTDEGIGNDGIVDTGTQTDGAGNGTTTNTGTQTDSATTESGTQTDGAGNDIGTQTEETGNGTVNTETQTGEGGNTGVNNHHDDVTNHHVHGRHVTNNADGHLATTGAATVILGVVSASLAGIGVFLQRMKKRHE